ncbi:MAG: hypothetical protein AAGI01_04395, partial [Myxococcota bacterium]
PRLIDMAMEDEGASEEAFKILEESATLETIAPAWKRVSLELKYASGCKDHARLLKRARDLGDARVLPAVLKKHDAPKRGCGRRNRKDCYGCIRKELAETVELLRSLQEGAPAEKPSD